MVTVQLLPSSQIHVLVAFFVPGANSEKVKVAEGEGNTLRNLPRKWHCDWLKEYSCCRKGHRLWGQAWIFTAPGHISSGLWGQHRNHLLHDHYMSCAEIRTSKNLEFRFRWAVREDTSLWQTANTVTSYQGRWPTAIEHKVQTCPFSKTTLCLC